MKLHKTCLVFNIVICPLFFLLTKLSFNTCFSYIIKHTQFLLWGTIFLLSSISSFQNRHISFKPNIPPLFPMITWLSCNIKFSLICKSPQSGEVGMLLNIPKCKPTLRSRKTTVTIYTWYIMIKNKKMVFLVWFLIFLLNMVLFQGEEVARTDGECKGRLIGFECMIWIHKELMKVKKWN